MPDLDSVYIVGRFGTTAEDGPDIGEDPDIIWCDTGTISLSPKQGETKVAGGNPVPWTGGQSTFKPTIDTEGFLTWRGQRFMKVVDLASDKVNPRIPDGAATHGVRFDNVMAGTQEVKYEQRSIRLSADTAEAIDASAAEAYGLPVGTLVCDLTKLLPVPVENSVPIVVGPQGPPGDPTLTDEVTATNIETGDLTKAALDFKIAAALPARQTLDDLVKPFHYLHGVGSVNGLPLDPAGTLVAVENAIAAHPSDLVMVDLDYRRTRDSVLVSAHDATTGSASDVNVTIAATAFRDLPDIYKPGLYGSGYGRVPIASHEAILSAARGRAVFSIEIKDGLPAVPDVIALTNRLGMADSVVWNTGDPTVVAALVAGGLKAFMFNCTTTTKLDQAKAAGAWMVDVPTDASTALIDHAIGLGFAHVIRGFVTTAGTPQATDSFAQLVGMDSRLSAAGTDATGYLDRPGGATLRSADSIAGAIRTGKRGPGWRLVNSSNLTDWLTPGRLYTYKAGSMVYTFGNLAGTPYPAGVSAGQSGAVQTITAKIIMDTLPTTLTQSTRLKLYSPTEAPVNASANTVEGYAVGLQADGLLFLNSVPVGGGTPAAVFPNIQSAPLVAATEATVTCEIDDRTAGTQSIRITRQDAFVTLSSAITAGTITSLPVTATPAALANGAKLMLADGTTVNVNGSHALGVTSITVTSIAVPAQASGSSVRATSGWVNETTGGKAIWRGRYHSAYTTQTTGVGALTDLAVA